MKEVNKELIEEIEPQIQKTVGGPCEDFEFSDISNYHELLKYVGLGVHEEMRRKAGTSRSFENGDYEKEEHYVAHIFPNGDILDRVEIYRYDSDGNAIWHKSYSEIYTRGKDGKMYETVNHERQREPGMVLYYMERCMSDHQEKAE